MAAPASSTAIRPPIGDVWLDGVASLAGDWPAVLGLAAAFVFAPTVVVNFVVLPSLPVRFANQSISFLFDMSVSAVLLLPLRGLFAGALALRITARLDQRETTWPDCLALAVRSAPKLYAALLCAQLITTAGYMLLIVPGVIASVTLSILAPIVVVERGPLIGCLRRSLELTRGSRLMIFGFWLAGGFCIVACLLLVSVVLALIGAFAAGRTRSSPPSDRCLLTGPPRPFSPSAQRRSITHSRC